MGNLTDFLSNAFAKAMNKDSTESQESPENQKASKPDYWYLVPRSHVVKALQWTGENFPDVSLLVPSTFRAFMPKPPGEEGKDYLVIQTPTGTKFVKPGDYIVQGRVASSIGFFVFTEEELFSTFEVIHGKDADNGKDEH